VMSMNSSPEHEDVERSYAAAKRAQAEVRLQLDAFKRSRLRAAAPLFGLALVIATGAGGVTTLLGRSGALVAATASAAFAFVLLTSLLARAWRIRRAQRRLP
jgi:hypothetical protein